MPTRARILASLVLPVLTSGCYEIVDAPGVTTVTYAPWAVAIAWLVAAAAAAPLLRVAHLCYRDAVFTWGAAGALALLGLVALLTGFLAWTMTNDEVVLDEDGVHDHCGFPWERRWRGIRSADVERVTFETVESGYGARRTRDTLWILHRRDGDEEVLDVGDLWDYAQSEIGAHLEQQGVRVGADPARFGGASDDPFVATPFGRELRLDSDSADERLWALLQLGGLGRLASAKHTGTLRATLDADADPSGVWSWVVRDGPREVEIELELTPDGRALHRARRREGGRETELASAEGAFEVTETEITLRLDGAAVSVLRAGE